MRNPLPAWLMAICLLVSACRPPNYGLVYFSSTDVIRGSVTPVLDTNAQMHALKATDPLKEAQLALVSRDYRLISARMPFPVFLGIPEDELVFSARRQYGYKAIASTYELAQNPDFEKLTTDFAQKYNRLIYDFLRTNKELPKTGRAVAH